MSNHPFISICIPAYKRTEFLRRVLESVRIQTFRDFEVVVTDDSPDLEVRELCAEYSQHFTLHYFRNENTLGTPENWNEAIRRSTGEWIKLMHDDDYFASASSLHAFAEAASRVADAFIFCGYQNIKNGIVTQTIECSNFRLNSMQKEPVTLLSKNCIGPPSVVLHRRNNIEYDRQLKWLVDIDYYIRLLDQYRPVYLQQVLVNIGINDEQVTNVSARVREVEIPEHFAVLNKTGIASLRNLLVYDAWWRLFRNLNITSAHEIPTAGYPGIIPEKLLNMLRFESKVPRGVLKFGPASKILMLLSYLLNR